MVRWMLCGAVAIGALLAAVPAAAQTATAELRNAQGTPVGQATLTEGPQGVRLQVTVSGPPRGDTVSISTP